MAFELKLKLETQDLQGHSITVVDDSDWSLLNPEGREDYGVFVDAIYYTVEGEKRHYVNPGIDPGVDSSWESPVLQDGRFGFTAYAFKSLSLLGSPREGDVAYDPGTKGLVKYTGGAWFITTFYESLDKAHITGVMLDLPILMYSENYRNRLNLEYIRIFRDDYINGEKQNKLYYKRSTLDYVNSLIEGAKYSWAIKVFMSYINIVSSLNEMKATDKTA